MHDIVPVFSRRIEAEDLLQLIQKFLARFLRDANGAITLNVRVSSHRYDAGARSADISA
jgi:hypothetical protein